MAVGGSAALGWDDWFEGVWTAEGCPAPVGRAARVDRGWVSVLLAPDQEQRLTLDPGADVAVGDWLVVDIENDRAGQVLARRSVLARRAADGSTRAQVLATNVDTIFLVHSLEHPPNTRRLERELVLAFESGAQPVVVLNKADVVDDVEEAVAAVEAIALAIPVHAVSARTGAGVADLVSQAGGHHTIALLGPSGAGKSTLVNRLAGATLQRTAAVREFDQKGRHTTSAAQLVLLEGGGLLVDTPGLRAVALWSEGGAGSGLARAFEDVTTLAEECRFADCRHDAEPDCAVREAVEAGLLDPRRLASWQHLTVELDRLAGERATAQREARRGRPPRVVESAADDVAGDDDPD